MKSKLFTAALAALVLASCAPKENGYLTISHKKPAYRNRE